MSLLYSLLFLVSLSSVAAEKNAKIVFFKGDVTLIREEKPLLLKRGLQLKTGDIIHTEKTGLAIIKSKASTYKVTSNSTLKIDLDTPEIINSDVKFGTVVVRFFKNKLNESVGQKLRVKTPTASMGVRGTRFFTHVGVKDRNSFISVESGSVGFAGKNSLKELAVSRGMSSMTNKNNRALGVRQFGFEDKINWELDENSDNLSHDPKLISELDRAWKKYKEEQVRVWKKRSQDMSDLWKKYKN